MNGPRDDSASPKRPGATDLFGDLLPPSSPTSGRTSGRTLGLAFGPADTQPAQPTANSDPKLQPTIPSDETAERRVRSGLRRASVQPADVPIELHTLADSLTPGIRLGTSSWNFPGWSGLVWADECAESTLSRHGLPAYSAHPLLRTVSLDRAFYRPMTATEYARLADQTPEDFRFLVKAPALITDALVRGESGQGMQANPAFLDPELAWSACAQPLIEGMGSRLGVLVLQLSPLPQRWLADGGRALRDALRPCLARLQGLRAALPHALLALEIRNPQLLTPALGDLLKAEGVTYCLGLHAKMPAIDEQLPMLRALWPGPLVCRWSLHSRHGAYGYEAAKAEYAPFNRLVDPDPHTRSVLAKVMAATAGAGFDVYVTINNKAEGSAPLSVIELAREVSPRLTASA